MLQTDVKAKNMSATGASGVGSTRIKAIHIVSGATAGSVSLKDGGSSGTELLFMATPASAANTISLLFPGEGIKFAADPYLTLTNAGFVTFFYG